MANRKSVLNIDWSSRSKLRGPGEQSLGDLVQRLRDRLAPEAMGISISYVDDRVMRKLNRLHRDQNKTTDVLSFPSEPEKGAFPHLGDIVISLPFAEKLAKKLGVSRRRVVETLFIHGFLHLVGHDHEADRGEMMELQAQLEKELLESDPLSLTKKRGRKPGSKLKKLTDGSRIVVTGRAAKAIAKKEQEQKSKPKTRSRSVAPRSQADAPRRGPGRPKNAGPADTAPGKKAPRRRRPTKAKTGVIS